MNTQQSIRSSGMRNIIYIVVIVILSGCATAYQPRGATGGFSEMQLRHDVFQVSFDGNGFTSKSRAADFMMLRNAEITLENGYRYFVIVDPKVIRESEPLDEALVAAGVIEYAAKNSYASNTIICFRDDPDNALDFYDAELVYRSIRKKYGIIK